MAVRLYSTLGMAQAASLRIAVALALWALAVQMCEPPSVHHDEVMRKSMRGVGEDQSENPQSLNKLVAVVLLVPLCW
jgi:hypothetical protein